MNARGGMICLLVGLAGMASPRPAGGAALSMNPAGNVGVDVLADGKVVAPIRLSSNGAIVADQVQVRGDEVRLTGLRCKDSQALTLAADDFVSVRLAGEDGGKTSVAGGSHPQVRFRLTIAKFDAKRWESLFGDDKAPFHFLTCSMPTAAVWHQRGWLNATPNADPFPLLADVHAGTPEISCTWNRNWGYICPLGGHPIPMIGLWDPAKALYVGYDFQEARASDQSERYIATAYCWQQGQDKSFITLAFPHGGLRYGELIYPKGGEVLESRFHLIVQTDVPGTEDPNERFQSRLFERYAESLPRVPAMNDLSWIPGSSRLQDFMEPAGLGLWGPGEQTMFYPAGTVIFHGWGGHREMPIDAAAARGDARGIEAARSRVEELLHTYAKRFTAGGEECLFWEMPLKGSWQPEWGGPGVTTLHNSDGWYPARVLVELYRYDRARGRAKAEHLKAIDGIFNWAKHFVWTRNEFADVPSSPFAIGGTLSAAFLLDYHFTFKDDPERGRNAQLALNLARNIVWRYLPIWAMDSDRFDGGLDSAFLIEPNSGRDWAGLGCANEVTWIVDTLTQVYVHTGDPRMRYYLRGILERWPALYRRSYAASLAECGTDAMTEGLGLFDGAGPGRGERYEYGWADLLPLNEPVGRSKVRVVAGQRACIAFCKDGTHSDASEYRTDGSGACSFRVDSVLNGPFDLSFSYPCVDVSRHRVRIVRDGKARDLTGEHVRRPPQAPSSLYIRGVCNGDRIEIGRLPEGVQEIAAGVPLTYRDADPPPRAVGDFALLDIAVDAPLAQDWNDLGSYAGIVPGVRWVYGVPYYQRTRCATKPLPLSTSGSVLFVAYSPANGERRDCGPVLQLDDGSPLRLAGKPAVVWRGWPPMYKRVVLLDYAMVPPGRTLKQIDPAGTSVMAVSAFGRQPGSLKGTMEAMAEASAREHEVFSTERRIRQQLSDLPDGKIALLPGAKNGSASWFCGISGLSQRWTRISPEQVVDAQVFNARLYPVAFHLGDEGYLKTIRSEGDGKAAITRYLADGGVLIILASGVFPFFYGHGPGGTGGPADPLLPAVGLPIHNAFEAAPEGLRMVRRSADILPSVPPAFSLTQGDLRLRSVDRTRLDHADRYIPLIAAVDAAGRDYGDAACWIRFGAGPAKGGRVLYVWSTLSACPQGLAILGDAVSWALREWTRDHARERK